MRRLLPSPALIVACLALVVALGGVSYATVKIGTKDLQRDAVTSAKIKDGAVHLNDLAAEAIPEPTTVQAFADITVKPVAFDPTRMYGFSTVTRPKKGVYCLTLAEGIDPTTTAPVVGVDWDISSGANLAAFLSKSAYQCPEGTDLGVRTFSWSAGGDNVPSNVVGFTVVVP